MRQKFNRAASPYLLRNSKESRTVRGFMIFAMLGGMVLSIFIGMLPGA